MRRWQLHEAKARLSALVRAAQNDGPQEITVRGRASAVVLSRRDFDKLTGRKPSFVELIRRSPLMGAGLEIERDKSPVRDVWSEEFLSVLGACSDDDIPRPKQGDPQAPFDRVRDLVGSIKGPGDLSSGGGHRVAERLKSRRRPK
jgi:antitoxin Phd